VGGRSNALGWRRKEPRKHRVGGEKILLLIKWVNFGRRGTVESVYLRNEGSNRRKMYGIMDICWRKGERDEVQGILRATLRLTMNGGENCMLPNNKTSNSRPFPMGSQAKEGWGLTASAKGRGKMGNTGGGGETFSIPPMLRG